MNWYKSHDWAPEGWAMPARQLEALECWDGPNVEQDYVNHVFEWRGDVSFIQIRLQIAYYYVCGLS